MNFSVFYSNFDVKFKTFSRKILLAVLIVFFRNCDNVFISYILWSVVDTPKQKQFQKSLKRTTF